MKLASLNFYDAPITFRNRVIVFQHVLKELKENKIDILLLQEVIWFDIQNEDYKVFNKFKGTSKSGGLLVLSKEALDVKFTKYTRHLTGASILTLGDWYLGKGFQSFLFNNIRITNTHLNSTYLNTQHELDIIAHQLDQLALYINNYDGQQIVAGDFNIPPNHPLMIQFIKKTGLGDLTKNIDVTLSTKNTNRSSKVFELFPHLKDIRVDYILGKGIKDVKSQLIFDQLYSGKHISDHYGVMIEI